MEGYAREEGVDGDGRLEGSFCSCDGGRLWVRVYGGQEVVCGCEGRS